MSAVSRTAVYDWDKLYGVIDEIVAIAEARGVSGAQVALAWLIGRPGVTSVIIGGRNEKQFQDNIAAASFSLSAEERARLDKAAGRLCFIPFGTNLLGAGSVKARSISTLLDPMPRSLPVADFLFEPHAPVSIPIARGGLFAVRRVYCVGRNYAEHIKENGQWTCAIRRSSLPSLRCRRRRWRADRLSAANRGLPP